LLFNLMDGLDYNLEPMDLWTSEKREAPSIEGPFSVIPSYQAPRQAFKLNIKGAKS
jgi:hypothetical protein